MCDTVLAAPDVTAEGVMLFGKNSDRQRNEAHLLEVVAGAEHAAGETVTCTYVAVPQARRTFAALFCRPFWTWGPEMGVNEHGVAIGNEAVYTRGPPPATPALIGMDLAGLALQRAESAAEAVEVIAGLLGAFGQGGDCGHLTPAFYNNSYIVADAREAWVLETVGREWLAERVTAGVRTISNIYGLARPDRRSAGLDRLIAEAGWPDPAAGGYAAALADPEREHLGQARVRQGQSQARIAADTGAVDAATLMAALRAHGTADAGWTPATAATRSVCMHAAGDDRGGQTTGSLVSELRDGTPVHWVTGTAAPCLSVFKPVFLDAALPAHGPPPRGDDDPATLWWRHERLHRAALRRDYPAWLAHIAPRRDRLEAEFRDAVAKVRGADTTERAEVVEACWRRAEAAEAAWLADLSGEGAAPARGAYAEAWAAFDRLAGLP